MSQFMRLKGVPFTTSVHFATKSGTHCWLTNQSVPIASPSLYNHSDSPYILTLPPKVTVYLPGLFLQDKYGDASAKVENDIICLMQPITQTQPVLKSAKAK
jgi:hypothetical protein